MSEEDRLGRRKRSWVIVAIAAVAVIVAVTVSTVGSRRVASDAAEVRERANSATIDPSTVAFEGFGSDTSVADALGVDPTDLVLRQDRSSRWCVKVEISHLTSSQVLYFKVDDNGGLSEIEGC